MPSSHLLCPKCRRPLVDDPVAPAGIRTCPACGIELEITVFPAFGRGPVVGGQPEKITGDDEASCFFHAGRKAAVPCDRCGRFLCALCDLTVGSQHICPDCFNTAREKRSAGPAIEPPRVRWDVVAWSGVLLPVLLCWVVVPLTGVASAITAFWSLKFRPSRVVNSRLSLLAAGVVGLVLSAAATVGLIAMIHNS